MTHPITIVLTAFKIKAAIAIVILAAAVLFAHWDERQGGYAAGMMGGLAIMGALIFIGAMALGSCLR